MAHSGMAFITQRGQKHDEFKSKAADEIGRASKHKPRRSTTEEKYQCLASEGNFLGLTEGFCAPAARKETALRGVRAR